MRALAALNRLGVERPVRESHRRAESVLVHPLLRRSSELLTQAAAVAELVLDYGHPRGDIIIDSLPYFDAIVYSDDLPYIAVEAKRSPEELKRMLVLMRSLSNHPWEHRRVGELSNSEQKYQG